jgi:hypothetical protein
MRNGMITEFLDAGISVTRRLGAKWCQVVPLFIMSKLAATEARVIVRTRE